jgi:hypothetical protein
MNHTPQSPRRTTFHQALALFAYLFLSVHLFADWNEA